MLFDSLPSRNRRRRLLQADREGSRSETALVSSKQLLKSSRMADGPCKTSSSLSCTSLGSSMGGPELCDEIAVGSWRKWGEDVGGQDEEEGGVEGFGVVAECCVGVAGLQSVRLSQQPLLKETRTNFAAFSRFLHFCSCLQNRDCSRRAYRRSQSSGRLRATLHPRSRPTPLTPPSPSVRIRFTLRRCWRILLV
jgi:hypothetical protein